MAAPASAQIRVGRDSPSPSIPNREPPRPRRSPAQPPPHLSTTTAPRPKLTRAAVRLHPPSSHYRASPPPPRVPTGAAGSAASIPAVPASPRLPEPRQRRRPAALCYPGKRKKGGGRRTWRGPAVSGPATGSTPPHHLRGGGRGWAGPGTAVAVRSGWQPRLRPLSAEGGPAAQCSFNIFQKKKLLRTQK